MKRLIQLSGFTLVGLACMALASSSLAGGGGGRGGGGGGGGGGSECLDVYAPVICSNGVVYSNACYASKAKATGCVPYGGDAI